MTPAQRERAEQIKNAEAACRAKEITPEQLLWFRRITLNYLLKQTPPRRGRKNGTK